MSATDVRVRTARPADRPAIRALRSALAHPTEGLLAAALAPSGSIEGAPVALVALVAIPGEREKGTKGVGGTKGNEKSETTAPVGYALAVPGPAGASPAVVTIVELAVAPAARRDGVGTALVEAVAARFPGHDRLRVTARADDDRALDFYRALGFEERERLDGYYRDGDAVRLDRPVSRPAGGRR